ncbi:MAG: cobalamin B12-binding domain-containing protein [Pseudomonadota bacterium]|nr:cobalamin B12-binding domain-containing protein [Pseudomonadota bacterium]
MMLNISAVERETGLSKDVLRMWERRYAFPQPVRDHHGERQYSSPEIAKLRAIKRLMDAGMRPGRLIGRSLDELHALAGARPDARVDVNAPGFQRDVMMLIRGHDVIGLQHAITNTLMRQGVQRFVLESAAPLNRAVGEAWGRGELQVYEEHLYTEYMQSALRTAINAFPRVFATPRILLTTLPGEQHGLGLLMLEAVLAPEGGFCISLGIETPLGDVRHAALAHKVDIVALSFSAASSLRQASDALLNLRTELPANIALWAGGEMTRRLRRPVPGVTAMTHLADSLVALKAWRARDPQASAAEAR